MHKVVDMGALDEWIWAQLETSQHPQDFVNFARHALGRPAPIEAALDKAVELQVRGPSLASSASSMSEQVLAQMESRAEEGELPALLAASRWRMLGIGCTADRERALDWIERGIAQGHAYCLAVKGRFLSEDG